MVERSPGLKAAFGVSTTAHAISQMRTASRFQALSAEGNSLDGLNIHCAIVDELHAHRTRKVFDVLETATGARTQPLLWLITTAGSDRSGICYEQRTYLTKILDGVVKDDTYFGVIYTIDDGDDWSDPKVWAKANPNYGVSVFPEDIERLCAKALKMPSAQNNFLTKRLSVWVNADSAFFNMAELAKCADPKLKAEDFLGEPCWIGIDLASRRDIAPRIQLFRRGGSLLLLRALLPSRVRNRGLEELAVLGLGRERADHGDPGQHHRLRLHRGGSERDSPRSTRSWRSPTILSRRLSSRPGCWPKAFPWSRCGPW